MPRVIFNDGEEIVFQDFRDLQSLIEKEYNDNVLKRLFQDEDGFIGDGLNCTFQNATTIQVQPGCGFITDGTVNSKEPTYRGIQVDAVTDATLTAADPTDPRIDIIVVKSQRDVSDTDTRDFKDSVSEVITPTLFNKEDKWGADILVVAGTPDPSPVAPAVPAGYIQLCEVSVPAGTGPTSQSNITDKRNTLALAVSVGVDINTNAFTRLSTTGPATPVQTVLEEVDAELTIDENRLNDHEAAGATTGSFLIGHDPATPGDWSPAPAETRSALDQLASRAKLLEGLMLVGDVVDDALLDYVVPADNPNHGAGNSGLTDNASTNPRGIKVADLKAVYGLDYINITEMQRTGKQDANGLVEWEPVAPFKDIRVRAYGPDWQSGMNEIGPRLSSNHNGSYILITGVFDSLGLLAVYAGAQCADIDVTVDGVDTGVNLSLVGDEEQERSEYATQQVLSDATLQNLGMDLHTVKITNNDGNTLSLAGILLAGDANYNELAGNAFIKNQKQAYSEELGVTLPTINTRKGTRAVRYIDPADFLKKWATRDAKDIETTAGSISSGAGSFAVTSADDFLEGDIILLDDATSQELVVAQSVNPGTDIITLASNTINSYTSATVSLWARTLNQVDHDAFDEEVLDTFHFREFGHGLTTHPSALTVDVNSSVRATLQDHAHCLTLQTGIVRQYGPASFNQEGINTNGNGEGLRFSFYGTGVDVLVNTGTLTDEYELFVDDSPISAGNLPKTNDSQYWIALCAGLPLGWHTVNLKRVGVTMQMAFVMFRTYQPKLPAAVESLDVGVRIADVNFHPDYLFRSQPNASAPAIVSPGTYLEKWSRHTRTSNEGSVGGTQDWDESGIQDEFPFGTTGSCDRDDAYIERWFWGTGIEMFQSSNTNRGIWNLSIDGTLATTANFPTATIQGDGYNASTGAWDMYTASSQVSQKVSVSGLTLGWHKVRLQNSNTKNASSSGFFASIEAWGIIAPSWAGKLAETNDVVGFCNYPEGSVKDVRKLSPIERIQHPSFKSRASINDIDYTANAQTPVREMHGVINLKKASMVFIKFDCQWQPIGGTNQTEIFVSIDGGTPGSQQELAYVKNSPSSSQFASHGILVAKRLSAGKHTIGIRLSASAVTTRLTSRGRSLKVWALEDIGAA